MIAKVDKSVNVKWIGKNRKSKLKVGIVENKTKKFILTYRDPLVDWRPLHKDLGTLTGTTLIENVLSG